MLGSDPAVTTWKVIFLLGLRKVGWRQLIRSRVLFLTRLWRECCPKRQSVIRQGLGFSGSAEGAVDNSLGWSEAEPQELSAQPSPNPAGVVRVRLIAPPFQGSIPWLCLKPRGFTSFHPGLLSCTPPGLLSGPDTGRMAPLSLLGNTPWRAGPGVHGLLIWASALQGFLPRVSAAMPRVS